MHLISIFTTLFIFLNFLTNENLSEAPQDLPTKHFVLVHGSCHGAWSWYKLVALIKSCGHNVTALDMAASGVDKQQANSLKSILEYHKPLMEFMEALPVHEKVILVGHSSGGAAISQAMEMFPGKISVAVFVTAAMPGPDFNISTINQKALSGNNSLLDSRYAYDDGPNKPPTTFIFGPLDLSLKVYQQSPTQDWALATMLMRPTKLFSDEDMLRNIVLSWKNYRSVKRVFIVSEKDLLAKKDFQLWMTEKNPPDHVAEIKGSDHMVMISKPLELWDLLLCIAGKYTK